MTNGVYAMAVINYLDYTGLQTYDKLIKGLIAESIKTVKLDGDNLKFYRTANPAVDAEPDFEVMVAGLGDLNQLIKKVEGGQTDDIAVLTDDGSIKDSGISSKDITDMQSTVKGLQSAQITYTIIE